MCLIYNVCICQYRTFPKNIPQIYDKNRHAVGSNQPEVENTPFIILMHYALTNQSENAIRNPCSGIPDVDWYGYKLIVSYEHIFYE